jgi:hypothetical protein
VGALGIWIGWQRANLFIEASQGFVALGLLAVYLARAPDWSLLVLAAIAGGAALCTLANVRIARRT